LAKTLHVTKVFISHASEDKHDFVDELARRLSNENFSVWYDKWSLKLGDRLLESISRGLSDCDFGVVVLSKAFFSKRWPGEELEGLFALETKARKVILPVWKGVDESEVRQFSPIIAARLAARAAEGMDAVVAQIKRSAFYATSKEPPTPIDVMTQDVRNFDGARHKEQEFEAFIASADGVGLVEAHARAACELFESTFKQLQQTMKSVSFYIGPSGNKNVGNPHILASTGRVQVTLSFYSPATTGSKETKLVVHQRVFTDRMGWSGPVWHSEALMPFVPSFNENYLVWRKREGERACSNHDIVALAVLSLKTGLADLAKIK
jgi:hypothetical protein